MSRDLHTSTAPATVAMLTHMADVLVGEIKALRVRITELEGKRSMVFMGPHDPGVATYPAGAVVQRCGAAWVAMVSTSETPGSSRDWRRFSEAAR